MTKYIDQELARYWPVPPELMAQYNDGSHSNINGYGTLGWVQNNNWHRDDDKPAQIFPDGTLIWKKNGLYHRDGDKPAYIHADGRLVWHQNGQRHRIYGPAAIYPDGTLEWWINDENITQEVKKWLNRKRWRGTPAQIFEFQLRFS